MRKELIKRKKKVVGSLFEDTCTRPLLYPLQNPTRRTFNYTGTTGGKDTLVLHTNGLSCSLDGWNSSWIEVFIASTNQTDNVWAEQRSADVNCIATRLYNRRRCWVFFTIVRVSSPWEPSCVPSCPMTELLECCCCYSSVIGPENKNVRENSWRDYFNAMELISCVGMNVLLKARIITSHSSIKLLNLPLCVRNVDFSKIFLIFNVSEKNKIGR